MVIKLSYKTNLFRIVPGSWSTVHIIQHQKAPLMLYLYATLLWRKHSCGIWNEWCILEVYNMGHPTHLIGTIIGVFKNHTLMAHCPHKYVSNVLMDKPTSARHRVTQLLLIGNWYPSHLVGQMVTDTLLVTLGALVAPQHIQSFLTRLGVAQHCSTCKQCLQLLCQVAYSSAEEPLGWYTIAVWIFGPSCCCFHPGVLWEMEMMDTPPLCYMLIEVGQILLLVPNLQIEWSSSSSFHL